MAPEVGFEPTTDRLTADCSTTELLRNRRNGTRILRHVRERGNRKIDPEVIPLPHQSLERVQHDIDPQTEPANGLDASDLATLKQAQFDAISCSQNREKDCPHELLKALAGFLHELEPDGSAYICLGLPVQTEA